MLQMRPQCRCTHVCVWGAPRGSPNDVCLVSGVAQRAAVGACHGGMPCCCQHPSHGCAQPHLNRRWALLSFAPALLVCAVQAMPINDGWLRDWGPTCIARPDPVTGKRQVAGVHWDYDCCECSDVHRACRQVLCVENTPLQTASSSSSSMKQDIANKGCIMCVFAGGGVLLVNTSRYTEQHAPHQTTRRSSRCKHLQYGGRGSNLHLHPLPGVRLCPCCRQLTCACLG
jgi:hypothetical protein